MGNRNADVDKLMAGVDHPHKDAIEYLRKVIMKADPRITEQVKWNAPSFCYDGVDRITFQLKAKDVQLIFHRGAKVSDNSSSFTFDDDSGLLQWRTSDRAVLTFSDLADARKHQKAFSSLVKRWVKA